MHTGVYQRIGRDVYTLVAPPGYERDPAVTRAIHEFDPRAIPLYRVRRWQFPDGTFHNVVHHGIARYLPWPRYFRSRPLHVSTPAHYRGEIPNFLDVIFEDDSTLTYKRGGPGSYVPWNWGVYAWCRFQYDKTTVDSWLRRTEARKAREKREYEAMVAELEYRQKQIEPWLMKKAEQLTPKDWEEYLSLFKAPDPRVRREAMKRRMFVDVGRSHRAETHLRVAPAKRGSNAGQEAVEAP